MEFTVYTESNNYASNQRKLLFFPNYSPTTEEPTPKPTPNPSRYPTRSPTTQACFYLLDKCIARSDGWTNYYKCAGQYLYKYECPASANTACVDGTGFHITDNSRGCSYTFSTNHC